MPYLNFDIEEDFLLLGIHSYEEDYKLAYLLNKYLNFSFCKSKNKLDFGDSEKSFDFFTYKDQKKCITLYLINNKFIHQKTKKITNSLFEEGYTSVEYLIPEYKKVDYFLKIENGNITYTKQLIKNITKIQQITTSYIININQLKSKNNLIF